MIELRKPIIKLFGHELKSALLARADKFWGRVARKGADECWEWQGARVRKKYGSFSYNRAHIYAHIVAWILTRDEDIGDRDVCHTCDNPPCCNPSHLWLGTRQENLLDCVAKGRRNPAGQVRGSRVGTSKLTESDVWIIRTSLLRGVDLAKQYGTSPARISDIKRGRSWKHVPFP